MNRSTASVLNRVRKMCLALPDTEEKLAWGEPTFRVKKKLFVMFSNDHHDDGRVAIWCNAPEGVQEALVQSDPKQFFRPPYVGPSGWIGVRLDQKPDWKAVKALIEQAWRQSLPKRRRK